MLAQRGPEHEASIVRQLVAHAEATRPPDEMEIRLDVTIRFQACSDVVCYPPETRTFQLDVPIAAVHMSDRAMRELRLGPQSDES
ncbi:MAG: protein-disulfide reductase DsbD family protein [Chloroflexota bacterium]|nr:protein-disulfide reductase DsbD family protein [Chloroflexota bacterium]